MTRIYSAGPNVKGMIVDSTGSALVRSSSQTRAQEATVAGESFNINSGLINLTTANESGLLYYKHFEDKDIVIDSVIVGIENNGTDSNPTCPLTISRNPSGFSTTTVADIVSNRNFGFVNALDNSTAFKGAEGATVTSGEDFLIGFVGSGRNVIPVDMFLRKGNSLAIKLDLQENAATSINVYVALVCHLRQGDK